jgi:hypothetical protein
MKGSAVLVLGALLAVKPVARMTFVEDRGSRYAPVHHRSRPLGEPNWRCHRTFLPERRTGILKEPR